MCIREARDIESASAEAAHDRFEQRAVEIPEIIGLVLNVHGAVLGLERHGHLGIVCACAEREDAVRFAVEICTRALAVDIDRRFALIARRKVSVYRAVLARAEQHVGHARICALVCGSVFGVGRCGFGRDGVRDGHFFGIDGRGDRLPYLDRFILAEHGGYHCIHPCKRIAFAARCVAEDILVYSVAERQRVGIFNTDQLVLAVRGNSVIQRRILLALAYEISDGKERIEYRIAAVIACPV